MDSVTDSKFLMLLIINEYFCFIASNRHVCYKDVDESPTAKLRQ
jgi:hypothetical protein